MAAVASASVQGRRLPVIFVLILAISKGQKTAHPIEKLLIGARLIEQYSTILYVLSGSSSVGQVPAPDEPAASGCGQLVEAPDQIEQGSAGRSFSRPDERSR